MADQRRSCGTCPAMGFPDRSFRMESSSRTTCRTGDCCFPCISPRSLDSVRHDDHDRCGRGHRNTDPDTNRNCYPSHHSCRSHHNHCSRSCSPSAYSSFPYCNCPYCTSRHSRDRTCHRTVDSIVKGMAAGHSRFHHTDQSSCNWPAGFQSLISQHSGLTYGPRRLQPESLRPSASYTAGLCS